jgi:small subunit ribosomal protein S20
VANVASAEKRNRQRLTRRTRNVAHMSKLRSSVKKVITAVAAKDTKAKEVLAEAIKIIDKAAKHGVIKRETASRKISRLTKFVNSASAPAAK